MTQVTYDHRAVLVDGERTMILSGAVHYCRATPGTWPDLMRRSREAGLNTIETYVFWNLHERRRGVLDFSGRLDLQRFCECAAAEGLAVILRIGPYICAETNYGGFPPWLRDVPGMQTRTYNEPFMEEMARWMRALVDYLRPMFAPQGGPIILAQVENEYANVAKLYGADGERYLDWAVALGRSLDLGVPWILCAGGAEGAIETINGFFPHEGIEEHFRKHPGQPALSTELWPGWYQVWGAAHMKRPPETIAYATARFVAAGASGVNYYMWFAGTNFDREAMYLQTPHYGFDGGLDEFGLPTTAWGHLGKLHRLLAENAELLLENDRALPIELGPKQAAYVYGSGYEALAFVCNDDTEHRAEVAFDERPFKLAPRSVQIVAGGKVLFDTAKVDRKAVVCRAYKPVKVALAKFRQWAEPMPDAQPEGIGEGLEAPQPMEQLALTQDETDYCWYEAALAVAGRQAGEGTLTFDQAGDVLHVFVDGRLRATTPAPLAEDRGVVDGQGYRHEFKLKLSPGRHKLQVLACALGLIKGDWMLGMRNMVEECKGIWGPVRWNGKPLGGPWRMRPGLVGEYAGLYSGGGLLAPWKPVPRGAGKPATWYRTRFAAPKGTSPLALDLGSMQKGLAWVNGQCLGRYWLVPSTEERGPWLAWMLDRSSLGRPTQRHYHVPREWLDRENTLVLFEEQGGDPSGVKICEWK